MFPHAAASNAPQSALALMKEVGFFLRIPADFCGVAPVYRSAWRQLDIQKALIKAYNTCLSRRTVPLVAADANKQGRRCRREQGGVGFPLTQLWLLVYRPYYKRVLN